MKIGISTDSHGHLPITTHWPKTDYHIHCGDICPNWTWDFYEERTRQFNWMTDVFEKWCKNNKSVTTYFITGNHDTVSWMPEFQFRYEGLDNSLPHCINNKLVSINNVNIYGFPWTRRLPSFKPNDWPFAFGDHEQDIINGLPQNGIDIFVSHGPCYGILDKTNGGILTGSMLLREYILDTKPKYFLNGHIHEDSGIKTIDGITFINSYHGLSIIDI